jgi:type I restriction enzyme, S subunit
MNGELPQGWVETTVGEVAADISYGFTAKARDGTSGPRYLRITDIQNNTVDWRSVPSCNIPAGRIAAYELRKGDLVFARTGATTGKSFLIKTCPEAVFASYLIRVRPGNAVVPEFLAHFFQSASYWDQVSENISGSAQPNCNATKLSSLTVPIPPLSEQERIAAKLERLSARVDACQQRLAKVPVLLKRFRQSVLAAACSGQLTAGWREKHRQDDEWPVTKLRTIVRKLDQGWSPKCEIRPSPSPKVWGVIKTTAVQAMKFLEKENKCLPNALSPRLDLEIQAGDILITRAGPRARAGVCCLVRSVRPRLMACDKVYRFRINESLARAEFVEVALNTPEKIEEIDGLKTGISDSGVNLTQEKFLDLEFPLPPPSEQQEIVRQVQKLFALADRIEARFAEAQKRMNSITQSILAKAFRGELVPTEYELAKAEGRSFESAEELLASISRNGESGKKKTTTKVARKPNS